MTDDSTPDVASPPETSGVSPTPQPLAPEAARRWDWRLTLRWFGAEILIVVAGVLIALALNAWWGARQDAAREANYLTLVHRDLGQMVSTLEELDDFEARQLGDGVRAYHLLSAPRRTPEQQAEVSQLLARLTHRRTLSVVDAAYQDLVSTGNLRLVRNLHLRDHLVSFYEEAGRTVEVHNRNNWLFVDGMFTPEVHGRGLFFARPGSNLAGATARDSTLRAQLVGGFVENADPIWGLPGTAPEWDRVKGQLLLRIDIASGARSLADDLLDRARALRDAVNAEQTR